MWSEAGEGSSEVMASIGGGKRNEENRTRD
jgi:hypothetical protein